MYVALVISTSVFQLHVLGSNLQNSIFFFHFLSFYCQTNQYVLNITMYKIYQDVHHQSSGKKPYSLHFTSVASRPDPHSFLFFSLSSIFHASLFYTWPSSSCFKKKKTKINENLRVFIVWILLLFCFFFCVFVFLCVCVFLTASCFFFALMCGVCVVKFRVSHILSFPFFSLCGSLSLTHALTRCVPRFSIVHFSHNLILLQIRCLLLDPQTTSPFFL